MKEIIENQFKVLETFKYYDKKHAMKLNTGDLTEFYHKLVEYENVLSDKMMESIDKKLLKE